MSVTGSERLSPISVENYLSGEETARRKHEYVDGQVYAMVGGRYSHNLISSNVLGALHSQLAGTPCRALNSDSKVKVQVGSATSFYYPDVSVVCGDNIRDDVFQDRPSVIVEVLSRSTRRVDEGEKLQAYQKLETLSVYIMFEQEFAAATTYRRNGNGFEREVLQEGEAVIALSEINAQLDFSAVYAEVKFAPEPEPE